jgi:predicted DNA-binding transcriptional regulator YafY
VPVPLQLLRGLRSAIARRRVVSLRLAPGAGQRRVVEVRPLGLVRKAGTWYLVGRGSRGYGVVAVTAIELARATGAQYEPPRGFDLPRWWRASLARRARLPTL